MQAEIITIGDEILIGQIVDTNSAFIGKTLNSIGISVYQITSVQDEKAHILEALKNAESHAEVIIITGGLGPTKDDITKHTLTEYFNDTLVHNEAVMQHVKAIFKKHNMFMNALNNTQALVPTKAEVLHNEYGTAPGMWFNKNGKVFISLPGVPFEMKNLITNLVIPKLKTTFKRPYILHKTLLTYGLGESNLAERIEKWETNLPTHIKLAYLPNLGKVRLRLSAKGNNKAQIESEVDAQIQNVLPLIEDIFVGYEDNESSLEQVIASQLVQKQHTLAVAESCTGGALAEIFTKHQGASHFFNGGMVTYSTASKINVLGVDEAIIKKHSVVSTQVAQAMAIQVKNKFNTTYGIATTGNAGPSKGDSDVEVGTVCIAIASNSGVTSEIFNLGNHRTKVIQKAVNKCLELLQKEILKN